MKEYKTDLLTLTNECNMKLMARYPDNYFDLAIVDPPYGIGADNKNNGKNSERHEKKSLAKINTFKKTNLDSVAPDDLYFKEILRASKRQIIWGANFFGLKGGYLYWHKNVTMPTYSTGELAWLSWLNKIDFVDITWHGMLQQDMKNKETRIHPTQKPVALYKWILDKYAKLDDKILDTHLGSMSIAIACHDYGFHLTGCELDEDYFKSGIERVKNHVSQQKLF